MESNPLLVLADEIKALRDRKKALEADLKQLNKDLKDAEQAFALAMDGCATQSITHAGSTFYLINTIHASPVAGGKEALFDALRTEGYGDLITETVNSKSLDSFVKEQIAENDDVLPGWLDGLVNVFGQTTVGVRKAAR